MNTQVAITHCATETWPAAIAGHVSVLGEVGYDQARQAWNVVHATQFADTHEMRTATPGTLRYHSISCACEQCIRVDERIPSVSPPVTIAFDADELCGYFEFHKFMDVELRCGFSKGHASKHYDFRHRMKF
jgi:hypothetical protein